MSQEKELLKYKIVTGKPAGSLLNELYEVGSAFKKEKEDFYRIKLMVFSKEQYFLVKNYLSPEKYMIFSKMIKGDEKLKFINPVGSGRFLVSIKTHLLIQFTIPKMTMFMSLFPKEMN